MRELIGTTFVHLYCMDMDDAAWLLLLISCVYLFLYQRVQNRCWCKPLVGIGLLGFLAVVVYATVWNRAGGHTELPKLVPFHTYREVMNGGNPELYRSNFMNAALFYPAGLLGASLLPNKWPAWCRCLLVTVFFGAASAGIEYLQYRYALGLCEIDDVIHNTAGAFTGSLAAVFLPWLFTMIWKILNRIGE